MKKPEEQLDLRTKLGIYFGQRHRITRMYDYFSHQLNLTKSKKKYNYLKEIIDDIQNAIDEIEKEEGPITYERLQKERGIVID